MLDESEAIFKAKLLVVDQEHLGYTSVVFQNLESNNSKDRYIMCVKFPNWDFIIPDIGTIGYLKVKYITAGKDHWFDGDTFHAYKFTNVQLLKFIPEKPQIKSSLIVD